MVLSVLTGCENSGQETTLTQLGKNFKEITDGVSNEVVDQINEGINTYETNRIIQNSEENGTIMYNAEVNVKPFKFENIEIDGTINFDNYQPDTESPVLNGTLDCSLRMFYRPNIIFLGFPFITKINITGTVVMTGKIDTSIDIDIEVDNLSDPKVYSAVINGIDYAELIRQEIEKAKK